MPVEAETNCTSPQLDLQPLQFSRGALVQILDSLTDEQMIHVPVENANHALWTMGHLACADDFFLNKLGDFEPSLPDGWAKRFGWGHPCSPNAADFPPIAEVRQWMETHRTKLTDWLTGLTTAQLDASTGPDWADFAPTRRALVPSLAIHESSHYGQLTVVRKSLKLPPLSM